jgi:hypothetical protein
MMSSKNTVSIDLEEIRKIKQRLQEINAVDIMTLQLTDNGVAINITDNVREDWKFTGLTTFYFLDSVIQDKSVLLSDSGTSR